MKFYPIWFAVFTTGCLFIVLTGCAGLQQEGVEMSLNGENQTIPDVLVQEPPGRYYHYLAAQRLIRNKNMAQAARHLAEAVSADPASVLLKQELALVYLQLDRKDEALKLCEEILEIQPDNVEALIIAASIKQSKGDIEAARALYEKVIAHAPDRKNIYLVLGRLYFQDDLHDKAKKVFSRFVEAYPDEYVGYYYLGIAYAESGEKDKAIEAFNRSVEIEPGFVEARVQLVNIYDEKGEVRKVIDLYEEIVEEHPDNISAAIALGLLYLKNDYSWKADSLFEKLGMKAGIDRTVIDVVVEDLIAQERYEDAVLVIEGMLKGLPDDQDLHYLAGISKYLMDNYDDALFHFQQVSVRSRFYIDAVIQKASIYNMREQREKGIQVLESAFENADRFNKTEKIRMINFMGAFYIDAGQYPRAIEILRRGVAIDPENTDIRYNLGVSYDKNGERQKTIEEMKAVIEIDPEHADALNYLGYSYVEAGTNLEEAEDLIRRALELKPDSGYILDSLGWVYFKKGDIENAVSYLEKAFEKRPEDPEILDHLGDAYRSQGRTAEALEMYQRALRAGDPDDMPETEKKIEGLKKN